MPTLQFTLYDSFAEAAKAKSTSTSLFEQKLASSALTVSSGNLTRRNLYGRLKPCFNPFNNSTVL